MRFLLPAFVLALELASFAHAGKFVCYFATWATYREAEGRFAIEDIPGDLCTHAMYSFVGLDESTWNITFLDHDLDINQAGLTRFVDLKKTFPKLKTIISIGGWGEFGDKYSQMVTNPDRRSTFVRSAVDFLNKYGFDGLDVDWEYPGVRDRGGIPDDKVNFVSLLKELKQAFNDEGKRWELSIAVGADQSFMNDGYDTPGICQWVDYVNLMTYDMHGVEDGTADVHSPLYSRSGDNSRRNTDDASDNWLINGCPAKKIIVGVPFYGKSFNLGEGNTNYEPGTSIDPDNPDGDAGPYTQERGTLAYYEICDYLTQSNWTEKWDDECLVPYAYKGLNWVGYENPRSVQAKADFIKSKGYGGAMTWSIDMDDFRGICGEKYPLSTILRKTVV